MGAPWKRFLLKFLIFKFQVQLPLLGVEGLFFQNVDSKICPVKMGQSYLQATIDVDGINVLTWWTSQDVGSVIHGKSAFFAGDSTIPLKNPTLPETNSENPL